MFVGFLDMGALLTPGFVCTVKIKCLVLVVEQNSRSTSG